MSIGRIPTAALALCLVGVLACTPTGSERIKAYLPDTVSTAYMLFYDFNSPTVNGEDILNELTAVLSFTDATATINGFRDALEDEELDQARLDEIVKFLIAQGVDPSKFQVLARGVAPAISSVDGNATSRRVEIFIQPPS